MILADGRTSQAIEAAVLAPSPVQPLAAQDPGPEPEGPGREEPPSEEPPETEPQPEPVPPVEEPTPQEPDNTGEHQEAARDGGQEERKNGAAAPQVSEGDRNAAPQELASDSGQEQHREGAVAPQDSEGDRNAAPQESATEGGQEERAEVAAVPPGTEAATVTAPPGLDAEAAHEAQSETVSEPQPAEAGPGSETKTAPLAEPVRPAWLGSPAPPSTGRPHWLLSLFTPSAADTIDWARGNYSVMARGGRVDSPAGSGELKKQIQMIGEGSVLIAERPPLGAAPDVAPDGFAHPVFRAGFALAIPLPEAQ
jgi:hypothetical protein